MTCVIGGLGPQAQKAVRVTSTLSICLRLKVSFKFAQCSIVPMLSLLREHGPWSRSLSPDPPNVPRIGVGTTSPSPLCRSPIPVTEIQLWQRFRCDQD